MRKQGIKFLLALAILIALCFCGFSQKTNYKYSSDTSIVLSVDSVTKIITKYKTIERVYAVFTDTKQGPTLTLTKGKKHVKLVVDEVVNDNTENGIRLIRYSTDFIELWLTFTGETLLNIGLFKDGNLLIYSVK